MVSVHVELEQAGRKQDKGKSKITNVFRSKGSHEDSDALAVIVKIDNVEQSVSESGSSTTTWNGNECVPL